MTETKQEFLDKVQVSANRAMKRVIEHKYPDLKEFKSILGVIYPKIADTKLHSTIGLVSREGGPIFYRTVSFPNLTRTMNPGQVMDIVMTALDQTLYLINEDVMKWRTNESTD